MIRLNSLLLSFLISAVTIAQEAPSNPDLSSYIDSLKKEDQSWRNRLTKKRNGRTDTLNEQRLINEINKADKRHFPLIVQIFKDNGYPSYELVGKASAHHYWLLVQHQDAHIQFQEKILEAMEELLKTDQVSKNDYAYLRDRVNINKGAKQVYGTQMKLNDDKSSYDYLPVIEPDSLDARRKSMGLPPIDFYINIMNVRYHGMLKK